VVISRPVADSIQAPMPRTVRDLQSPTKLRMKAAMLLERAERLPDGDDVSELYRMAWLYLERAERLETSARSSPGRRAIRD
jgi:hypothetical protein